jgi:DNA-binding transcriptional LysR family regulator
MYQDVISNISLFVEVINCGSFNGAAKKQGLSKPSVSRRINELESHLKTKLIKRTTRKLSLTEAGKLLYNRCQGFDSTITTALQEITELSERPKGVIQIGFSSYLANDIKISKIIADFMLAHPGISIELQSFTSSHDIDLIKKNFHLYFTDNDMTSANLKSELLLTYPIKLCASPSYIQTHGMPQHPNDLNKHNCLLHYLYEKPITNWEIKIQGEIKKVIVKGSLYASRTHFLVKMARCGIGIAMLPHFMISKHLQSGELMTILNEYECKKAEVYITTYREKDHPKKLSTFIGYIKSIYNQ